MDNQLEEIALIIHKYNKRTEIVINGYTRQQWAKKPDLPL